MCRWAYAMGGRASRHHSQASACPKPVIRPRPRHHQHRAGAKTESAAGLEGITSSGSRSNTAIKADINAGVKEGG